MDFRRYLAISLAAHGIIVVATLVAFPSTPPLNQSLITSIPLELVEDISEDPQMAGERDGQRSETPQRREVARPAPTPVPTPPPERPRPVDPSSAPAPPPPPPPPPQEAAPAPTPAPAPPVPTPPTPPARPQVAETQEPPDEAGLLRRIEEDRRREEQRQAAEEQRRQEQQRQEQARREEQRRQEQQRQEQARQEQQRQEQARREEQRRQAQARREEQRRQQQAQRQQQQFDAQQLRDIINRQQGAPTQTGTIGNNTRTASLGNPQGTGRRLTQSQFALLVGMIRDQIQPCWSPPSGGIAGNRIVVRIEIIMNRDGTLNGRPRVMNASADPQFRAIADSASRAIIRCAANGLRLPAEMYDAPNGWREIEFAFDPQSMS